MSVEIPDVQQNTEAAAKPVNGEQRLNGFSNGHSGSGGGGGDVDKDKSSSRSHHHKSSSHKDKSRDKDRDRDRNKDRSDHKSSKSSSSSHRDKDKSSSSSHRDKDKDRERAKDKDKEKEKSSSSSHHKSSRDKDRDRDKDNKHRSSSSHNKDKEREKEKTSSSGSNKEKESRDKDRHHKSSSSKDKHSISSSSKNRDKDRDKNRERDKDRDQPKSKDHHRDRDKDRKDKDRDRDRDRDRERKSDKEKQQSQHLEIVENSFMINKDEKDSINRDIKQEINEIPSQYNHHAINFNAQVKVEQLNLSQASSCDYSMSQFRDDEAPFEIKGEIIENGIGGDYNDDEDIPLFKRKIQDDDDEDEKPLTARKKIKTEKKAKKKKHSEFADDDSDAEEKPKKKKIKKQKVKVKNEIKTENSQTSPTKGRKKKEDEQHEVWKWWEEEKREDGVKWSFLEHKGPVFAPQYDRLPDNIKFEYNGKTIKLSQDAEEIACFYAKMLDHDYTTKKIFNNNFFKDWRKSMTSKERELITDLKLCNFKYMHAHFQAISEKNKNRTKEEKATLKAENEKLIAEYGFCTIDGHKEKIGNFKIEPPGLFRGRGEHPKMGMVKRRVMPEDILLNCSKDSKIPKAPAGHHWKEIRHDNQVTWLASWTENVQGQVKYIMLNPSSKLKGEKDMMKYETAKRLHKYIDKIRSTYRDEWKSKEMRIRQRAVALYFIDILALRAGNEKDEDQADTVGCCSLRVEHISLHKNLNDKENVVVFDFLGKDSIRYYNEVEVEKRVFKNLELFKENKKEGDDLFDRLNTIVLNEHLRELMEGLTAKVFRTYNASYTLQNQLDQLTDPDATVPEKLLSYNRANRAVAILCNHQRSVPKSHSKSMENLKEKIRTKRELIKECESEIKVLQKAGKRGSCKDKLACDKKKKQLERLKEQLQRLELQETDKDENKTIALGTSKLNYLDPRISVAWCKKYGVPIEKIFNKTQRDKFRWAIDMAGPDYRF